MKHIQQLKKICTKCKKCPLHKHKTNCVFGEGNLNADIMLIGEAPGKKEDETGRPFQGKAGNILNNLLGIAGINREDIFITNAVKCRTPKNRAPYIEEIKCCQDYLRQQIEIIKPKIFLAMGLSAMEAITPNIRYKLSDIEGEILKTQYDIGMLVTYHPMNLIYRPNCTEKIINDFKRLKKIITG